MNTPSGNLIGGIEGLNLASNLSRGLVSWWLPGWDGAGGRFTDVLQSNPGTFVGGPTWTKGPSSLAGINLASASQYIQVGSPPGYTQVTIAALLRTEIQATGGIFDRDSGTANSRYWQFRRVGGTAGVQVIYFNSAGTAAGAQTLGLNLSDGKWHLVVGTWDGATVRIYHDAGLVGESAALSGAVPSGVQAPRWGNTTPGTGSTGFVGDIGSGWLYNRVLTQSETAELYNQACNDYPELLLRTTQRLYFFLSDSITTLPTQLISTTTPNTRQWIPQRRR